MTIQWLGHACFRITHNNYTVVIDPYDNKYVPGYPPLHTTADKLLISHESEGHSFRAGVKLSGKSESENPFSITSFSVDHDGNGGIMRGTCLVHILEADGIKVAHMSDIGTQLHGDQIRMLYGADVIMATAGSLTGLPAQEIARMYDELFPRVLIPMHYRDGSRGTRRLETVQDLINCFDGTSFAHFYPTDTLEITDDLEPQIAVLKFIG